MIIRHPEPLSEGTFPPMVVEDCGDAWGWECRRCGHWHLERDGVGFGDELGCDDCDASYVCVEEEE